MSALSKVLDDPKRVELLLDDLASLLHQSRESKFDLWDYDQKTNRAIMMEESSLFFSALLFLRDSSHPDRELLFEELLSELEEVDAEVLCESSLSFLQAGNRLNALSVESILVKDMLHLLDDIKVGLSKSEKRILQSYFQSESFLCLLKSKFGVKINLLIKELTDDNSIYRSKIPPWLLLSMETLLATSRAWTEMTSWFSDQKKPKHIVAKKSFHGVAHGIDIVGRPRGKRTDGIDIVGRQREKRSRDHVRGPGGVHIGLPRTIDFKVHNSETSLLTQLKDIFSNFIY